MRGFPIRSAVDSRFPQQLSRSWKIRKEHEDLAELRQQLRTLNVVRLEQRHGTLEQIAGRVHVATRKRSPAGRRQPLAAIPPDRRAEIVDWPEFAEVLVGLLEVISENLLELAAAIAAGVELIRPLYELGVHRCTRSFEQAVVDGLAHHVVVEPEARIAFGTHRGANEVLARQRLQLFVR